MPITGSSCKVVMLPNGASIQATHTAILPFEGLSAKARKADVLPGLRPNSLVSVGKLSDAGYTTIFHPHREGVTVHTKNTFRLKSFRKPVLQGWRDANGLWRVSRNDNKPITVSRSKKEIAATAYNLPSMMQTIRYLHAAAGFPPKDTWIKAINNGHYKTWPGITAKTVNRYFPESVETQKGHLKKQRQNVRSTKQRIVIDETDESEELTRAISKQNIIIKTFNMEGTIYTDQTGRFPVQSNRGNTSLMVCFDVDANYIDAEPIQNHHDNQMIPAYQALWKRVNRGRTDKPKLHILENEASEAFKAEIKKNCSLQLVPPDTHRRNLAERAIQTFKSHFIAILAGVDEAFPMNLWDRLVPQAVLTLNLLRQSRKNPTISAYQHVNGNFDYNKMPLGPLGCAVEIHDSPNRRRTWDPRSLTGWYLGTSPEHYRCHKVFCKRTRAERISDTMWFKHRYITQPTFSPELQQANMQDNTEMEMLTTFNNILNNVPSGPTRRAAITETVPEPRVHTSEPVPEPRVRTPEPVHAPEPRVTQQNAHPEHRSKVPLQALACTNSVASKLLDKIRHVRKDSSGPTTRSKYAQAIDEITNRRHSPRLGIRQMAELAQAIMDDDQKKSTSEFASKVFDAETGEWLKYLRLINHPTYYAVWSHSSANEFSRLAQGVGNRIEGTNTIYFIHKQEVPQDRWNDVTYAKFVCELKPNKAV